MGKWSAIIKGGKYLVSNPVAKGLGQVALHPQQTLRGAGTAIKSATVGAGVGYVGWQALVNDKPVARTVGDALIGSDNVDAVAETAKTVARGVGEALGSATDAMGAVAGTAAQAGGALSGMSEFMRNVTGGSGTDMFSSFFSNIGRGNVSGLSIAGLLAAGLMVFGRFGWLGKIGGALLAMTVIGNNCGPRPEAQSPEKARSRESRARG